MSLPNQTSGLIFPLQLSGGKHSVVSGVDLIHSSIRIILSWPLFTRFFETHFGSRTYELVEEPNDDLLVSLCRRFVIDAINTWEKRVELIGLNISRPDPTKLTIELRYRVKELNIEDTFYYNYPLN